MKKKIFLISFMVVLFVCAFAISINAVNKNSYTKADSYNYYEDSIAEENLLYTATTKLDPSRGRFEMTVTESGVGFAKYDEQGNPISWYVHSAEVDASGNRNVIVKSALTLGGVGTVDANGLYTFGGGTVEGITSMDIVSANFFGTGVKTLPDEVFMSTPPGVPGDSDVEFTVFAGGTELLCLYLPKTLTAFPKKMCARSAVRIVEFEDNQIAATKINGVEAFASGGSPFAFCANLKEITIPEGITEMGTHVFRENCSLTYVKFPNSLKVIKDNNFFRCNNLETVIFSPEMTSIGCINSEPKKMGNQGWHLKYIYMPATINLKCNFSYVEGTASNGKLGVSDKPVVIFFAGTLDEAKIVAQYDNGGYFKTSISTTGRNMSYTDYLAIMEENPDYGTQYPAIVVYDANYCVIYNNGQHNWDTKSTYKDALTGFTVSEKCKECGKENVTEYAPLLTYKGYSAQIGGERVTVGYSVDKKTQAYLENLSYGLVIAIPGEGDDASAFNPVNPDFTVNGTATAVVREVSKKYDSFNLFVDGFNESNYAKTAVICAFVTDGKKVEYLCANELNEISLNEYANIVSFAEIAEACTPRYQITFACDEAMGTLEGETSQIVLEGSKTTTVKAVAKEGYTFACWSDGTQTPEITVTAEKKATLTASFVPDSTGLPVITINTENGAAINSLENYVNCEITLLDNTGNGDSVGSAVAEIKGRGNSTWEKFDKKPYKFKFDKKQDLFGYGKEKTWVLLADARDYSLIRNMLALNAGLAMSELGYTSKGQSVELYLNGEYRGVYYLCEQIQVKDNRVNITAEDKGVDLNNDGIIDPDSIGYLVEMDAWAADGKNQNLPNYTKDGDVFVTISGGQKPFVIKDPEDVFFNEDGDFYADKAKPYLDYIKGYLQECHNAINADATVEGNYEKLCELIDVKSFAQAYIIFDLFKNPDVNYSSVYYYKDAGGKLVAAPLWDFDMAIGNVTHKENNTGWQIFSNTERLWTAERNDWMRELLEYEEFRTLVYEELVANEKGIKDSIASDLAYARAHKEAYEKNFTKWNLIGNVNASQASGNWSVPEQFRKYATWEEHLDYIENYLNESYAYLLEYYAPKTAE